MPFGFHFPAHLQELLRSGQRGLAKLGARGSFGAEFCGLRAPDLSQKACIGRSCYVSCVSQTPRPIPATATQEEISAMMAAGMDNMMNDAWLGLRVRPSRLAKTYEPKINTRIDEG